MYVEVVVRMRYLQEIKDIDFFDFTILVHLSTKQLHFVLWEGATIYFEAKLAFNIQICYF